MKNNKEINWWKVSAILLAIILTILLGLSFEKFKQDKINSTEQINLSGLIIDRNSLELLVAQFNVGEQFILCDIQANKCIKAVKKSE